MARKKQVAQQDDSTKDTMPAPSETSHGEESKQIDAPQASAAADASIDDTLPEKFFESGDATAASTENQPSAPTPSPPPAERRFVAVTMVKVKGRYYSPGTPLPDALDEQYVEALLAVEAIAPVLENEQP